MRPRKKIEYWAEGFLVNLVDFPVYEDEGAYFPDVPLTTLGRAIGYAVLTRPTLLRGRDVRFLRTLADLSRSQTARELGVTRRTLINWEDSGNGTIGAFPLMHLALRCFFFRRIFADRSVPRELLEWEPNDSVGALQLSFTDFQKISTAEGSFKRMPVRRLSVTAKSDSVIRRARAN